jgi:hypothetical protein
MDQRAAVVTSICQQARLIAYINFPTTSFQSVRIADASSRCRGLIVLLWFVGTSIASVWSVFRDPKFAYRWVIAGALVPVFSVVTVVGVLVGVMLLTIGKKAVRKNLLALTIGLFLHLVFDGAFLDTKMFWWPLAGLSLDGYAIPLVERGLLNIPFELVGIALIFWTKRQIKPIPKGV